LNSFTISEVFLDGQRLVDDLNNSTKNKDKTKHGTNLVATNMVNKIQNSANTHSIISSGNTMHIKSLANPNMFEIVAKQDRKLLNVIGVIPGQIITKKRTEQARIYNGRVIANEHKNLAKLAVIERHRMTGNIGLGFVHGLGLNKGAIVSSVAHDSHNLVVAGMNDIDMMIVARHISSIGGGLAVAEGGQVKATMSLPIAGLMSEKPIEYVIEEIRSLNKAYRKLGNVVKNPFMLLSFLTLPVIPSLKLTDRGLVDVDRFQFTKLWLE
jgi:adenine deaminase